MLAAAEQFLEQQMHPTVIIRQYKQALEDIINLLEGSLSVPVDKNDKAALANVVCIRAIIFFITLIFIFIEGKRVCGNKIHWTLG